MMIKRNDDVEYVIFDKTVIITSNVDIVMLRTCIILKKNTMEMNIWKWNYRRKMYGQNKSKNRSKFPLEIIKES